MLRDSAIATTGVFYYPHLGKPGQPIFPGQTGVAKVFTSPDFAIHNEAWAVGNIKVEIGLIRKTNSVLVYAFNQLVMDVFHLASGNMLQNGNLLSWNVSVTEPGPVDREEWRTHAKKWRDSIDADHGSPNGPGTIASYFDGSPFDPVEELIENKIKEIIYWIWQHL